MTSKTSQKEAFVWIYLPNETSPVVAGKLVYDDSNYHFNYGKSYLEREGALSINPAELPLRPGILASLPGLNIPGCIRDAAPDAWGRRVIINKLLGSKNNDLDNNLLNEITYLLHSGNDRIGALDFQQSATHYAPQKTTHATLEELQESARRVEKGIPLTSALDLALFHGSSIGGARPKALIVDNNKKYVAKFSSTSDLYSIVKAEYIAMRLAHLVGLDTAKIQLKTAANKDVLLVERFDQTYTPKGWTKKIMHSALTLLELDEMMARYASYQDFAEIIRHKFYHPKQTLKELFSRLIFNILCGNTDDHARNHAAFWDGSALTLTPAYDICPQGRTGNEASQAMIISEDNRKSQLASCIQASACFLLSKEVAMHIIDEQVTGIKKHWNAVCDEAKLTEVDKKLLWRRQFLNPYVFEGD
jgi:serine/threonine-protein kinase HipA